MIPLRTLRKLRSTPAPPEDAGRAGVVALAVDVGDAVADAPAMRLPHLQNRRIRSRI
jgi:hypothetical protein